MVATQKKGINRINRINRAKPNPGAVCLVCSVCSVCSRDGGALINRIQRTGNTQTMAKNKKPMI